MGISVLVLQSLRYIILLVALQIYDVAQYLEDCSLSYPKNKVSALILWSLRYMMLLLALQLYHTAHYLEDCCLSYSANQAQPDGKNLEDCPPLDQDRPPQASPMDGYTAEPPPILTHQLPHLAAESVFTGAKSPEPESIEHGYDDDTSSVISMGTTLATPFTPERLKSARREMSLSPMTPARQRHSDRTVMFSITDYDSDAYKTPDVTEIANENSPEMGTPGHHSAPPVDIEVISTPAPEGNSATKPDEKFEANSTDDEAMQREIQDIEVVVRDWLSNAHTLRLQPVEPIPLRLFLYHQWHNLYQISVLDRISGNYVALKQALSSPDLCARTGLCFGCYSLDQSKYITADAAFATVFNRAFSAYCLHVWDCKVRGFVGLETMLVSPELRARARLRIEHCCKCPSCYRSRCYPPVYPDVGSYEEFLDKADFDSIYLARLAAQGIDIDSQAEGYLECDSDL